ncbi:hypothetical protein E2C01_010411 [Portunus trituberculatus]|uniref:Uncharacterized protein n=1 Tax=Portunus trituberculatus TaxID=210409 RepID=A0A5B7D8A4_PORTR|nr:hypothetical protein [Portunus trituberculatus]
MKGLASNILSGLETPHYTDNHHHHYHYRRRRRHQQPPHRPVKASASIRINREGRVINSH